MNPIVYNGNTLCIPLDQVTPPTEIKDESLENNWNMAPLWISKESTVRAINEIQQIWKAQTPSILAGLPEEIRQLETIENIDTRFHEAITEYKMDLLKAAELDFNYAEMNPISVQEKKPNNEESIQAIYIGAGKGVNAMFKIASKVDHSIWDPFSMVFSIPYLGKVIKIPFVLIGGVIGGGVGALVGHCMSDSIIENLRKEKRCEHKVMWLSDVLIKEKARKKQAWDDLQIRVRIIKEKMNGGGWTIQKGVEHLFWIEKLALALIPEKPLKIEIKNLVTNLATHLSNTYPEDYQKLQNGLVKN